MLICLDMRRWSIDQRIEQATLDDSSTVTITAKSKSKGPDRQAKYRAKWAKAAELNGIGVLKAECKKMEHSVRKFGAKWAKDNLRDIQELIAQYEREQERARSQAPTDLNTPRASIETVQATVAQRTRRKVHFLSADEAASIRDEAFADTALQQRIARALAHKETAYAA